MCLFPAGAFNQFKIYSLSDHICACWAFCYGRDEMHALQIYVKSFPRESLLIKKLSVAKSGICPGALYGRFEKGKLHCSFLMGKCGSLALLPGPSSLAHWLRFDLKLPKHSRSPAGFCLQLEADKHNAGVILLKTNQQVITAVDCCCFQLQTHGGMRSRSSVPP